MAAEPELVVAPTPAQLAEDVAGRVVATLVAALDERGTAHLTVTGGGILEDTMRALRDLPGRDSVDWSRVHVWWGDERFVPSGSGDRNDRAAAAALFDAVPAVLHRMPADDGPLGDDADAAAGWYAAELAAAAHGDEDVPHFDVALLGIGPDGHCCSLFPEHPGVYEQDAAVIAVRNSPKPPPTRLSLTFPALDAAAEIWFVAAGEGKANAVALALGGAGRVQVPAAGPRGTHRTLWLVDRAAASHLPPHLYKPPVG
ncbi:MAG: 6-phosphogluconolactonase [Jatrophihabitans sp.]|nr:MAG: 6-phosphogluconolactonase [Jatrophihabitans sp.]